jgi:Tol biopolymer transport system component
MRYGWAPIAVLTAACYQPTASPGAPCGPGDACPSGLTCQAGVCVAPGGGLDDASPPADAPTDTSSVDIDAPVDAAPLGPWGSPTEIELTVGGETDPSMSQDLRIMAFMSEDDDDLYMGIRATPTSTMTTAALDTLNSTSTEKSPELSPDARTLYFVSNRDGDFDVYMSTFGTTWSDPVRVDELSTAEDDSDIGISPDGLTAIVIVNGSTNVFAFHTRASTDDPWGPRVDHLELSVGTDPSAPSLTNDGQVVYLHRGSTRDIFVAYKQGDGTYTAPVAVDELNTGSREAAPFVLPDNRHIVFERSSDIYEASR